MFGEPKATLWTIGHSTRSRDEFLGLLRENRIELLADVRHFPASKHVPWTNRGTLEGDLAAAGVRYEHLVDLGGYRTPRAESVNTAWRNASFRGYADYMGTEAFQQALDRLIELAGTTRTAIMCAEAVPWRCHRSLLSDALSARGVRVVHILGPGKTQEHTMTEFAKVHAGRVTYPAARDKAHKRRTP